jgi:hypothetical protein
MRCREFFTLRRFAAWLIDITLSLCVFVLILFLLEQLGLKARLGEALMLPAAAIPAAVLHLMKDGAGGKSIGKRLLGLTVVSMTTGHPIGFPASMARTMPQLLGNLSVPIAGVRDGEEAAGTRVIWDRKRESPVFRVPPDEPEVA